ncbi:chromatin structure-remodeling complex protein SYD-like [Dorcoceras hygrometricum]|uniref:Chromatin structure-remodeling complex protein SYD-like n=1 Tax=Dorcoceras hygrometricum TaxID=472368 RepID=A0A2Z7C7I2_9LAMI|nr:chromatin structure-remodeling complex protein SYD-like [Dorcoceras hygrometricum]
MSGTSSPHIMRGRVRDVHTQVVAPCMTSTHRLGGDVARVVRNGCATPAATCVREMWEDPESSMRDMRHNMHNDLRDGRSAPARRCPAPTTTQKDIAFQRLNSSIRIVWFTISISISSLVCTRKPVKISQTESSLRCGRNEFQWATTAASAAGGNDGRERRRLVLVSQLLMTQKTHFWIYLSDHGKRLEISPHDTLGITDSACKNQLIMVTIQYAPFSSNILTKSTTIGKSRVAKDSIAMHTSWRSNSDIACATSYRVEDFESELIRLAYSGYFSYRVSISDLRVFRFDSETSVTDTDSTQGFSDFRFDSVSILRGEYKISDLTDSITFLKYERRYFRCDGYTRKEIFLVATHKGNDRAVFRFQCFNRCELRISSDVIT